ncbi:acetate kinase [Thalassotalea sp. HSM 43]|uniref:acetate kinase n=1 Tax=Thalassotalea sp. HSM 43 TaxID=2552945 RepID=UPI00108040BD|nr:acetate kinase [Thalassotalea sp. HSM 43]QBY03009.1 acetate kinase [Thalassotalea sp. HSM 43]
MSEQTVLVINCGSSSLKFSLIDPDSGEEFVSGVAERLMTEQAFIKISHQGKKQQTALSEPFDHQIAVNFIVGVLEQVGLADKVSAVGHRVVHGGESYSQPTMITDEVKASIAELGKLAPLHNPVNLVGVEAAEQAFEDTPQVAVFDTAFHQTMPEKAFIYGLPYHLYKQHGIRRYGFHGTSHFFVANQAAKALQQPINETSVITAHLGNGCSISAIENGKSVDTSMGLTPLEGVVMGTRSGDIDPGIVFHLIEQLNYTPDKVNSLLNKESGLLGISQMSNDCRTIEEAIVNDNDQHADLTMDIFCYRIAKSIASFMAALSHFDALVFTGGIGENSNLVRSRVVRSLALLGLTIDPQRNSDVRFGKQGLISTDDSVKCLVIPTNEELVIAMQSAQVIAEQAQQ